MVDERIDIVPGTKFKIIQDKNSFSYGTDAIFISDFAKAKGLVIDLGTGSGIIPLRLIEKKKVKKIYGIEIQKEVFDRAKRSIKLNGLEERIEILNMDLKKIDEKFPKAHFDTVISKPPYLKAGGAVINKRENFAISRHEISCNLEDIIKTSGYLLKPQGKLFLVHRPDRLTDIFMNLRKYGIEPKRIRFVYPKPERPPNLVLIEGVKGGRADLKFLKPLIVYNKDSTYTEEIYKIYDRK
ncbi:MAG: tRNA1(Val) (adenine(37)-N6)-methyltransferase [Tissierella sp.]|uniref:tRNA1(Val) (adenine(37)-N6)-methyltransferase n=1 Tax=Tissierella sp. TaxID=41274 RepID=UPI003F9E8A3B